MDVNNIILFATLSFVIGVIPGPSTMFILYSSLRFGVRKSYSAAAGQLLSFILFFVLAALSIEWLNESIADSLVYLKYAGALYMLYMAYGLFRSSNDTSSLSSEAHFSTGKRIFTESIIVGLSNPKAIIYYALILPQFIDPNYSLTFQLTLFFVIDVLLGIIVISIYLYGAAGVKKLLGGIFIERHLNRIAATVLLCVALLMLFE